MSILKNKINNKKLPNHVAIIMDGNGRWAKQKGNQRIFGHKNAIKAVRDTVEGAGEIGIKHLTLYAFSTENWGRPKKEVDALMALLVSSIHKETESLNKNNVRLSAIGDLNSLPKKVYEELQGAIEFTSKNTGLNLILALSYSSKWEITNAIKEIAQKAKDNEISIDDINDELISSHLTTAGIPDPELMIRTSGEYRISNFLLWQLAYAELYFVEKFWPDFRKDDLLQAIYDFQNRERRFGKTSAQIS